MLLFGVSDLARLFVRITLGPIEDPARRLFLHRLIGGAVATLATGLGAFAMQRALGRVKLHELHVTLARLPRTLDGTTVVQLTDVHIGPTLGRAFIEELVSRTNALEPDIVAITGDLVDGTVDELRNAVAPLANLRAKHGVYFVTGNHEYYSGVSDWIAELRRLGVRVLRNERVSIGDAEAGFDLAGIDDHSSTGMVPDHGPDLGRALAGRDPSRELVLLAHQPRAIHEAVESGRRPPALGPHARRADLAVELSRAPPAAVPRRARHRGRDAALHQPRHRLLGTADAPRHARRDYPRHAAR